MLIPKSQLGYFSMHLATAANGNGTVVPTWTPDGGGYTTLTLQVTGTITATVTLQGSIDGTNFVPVLAENLTTGAETYTMAAGIYRLLAVGLRSVRVNVADYASGNVTVVGVAVA